jgi:hypothetical protein
MTRFTAVGLTVALVIPVIAWAGGAGNPAMTVGKDNYGAALEAEEQIKWVGDDLIKSRRFVGKLIWGAMDNLDLYARLGASDLRVDAPGYPDFKTPAQNMTWGGGARCGIVAPCNPNVSACVDLQMLSFISHNTVEVERFDDWGDAYTDVHDVRYKYNEIQMSVLGKWQHEYFSPYVGFGLTHIFGHVERKVTSELETGSLKSENDFREDAVPELILGMDFDLGGTGRLSGEMRLSNQSDISFFIGVSELLH